MVPNSEDDKLLFQELTLCPNGARGWVNDEGARGFGSLTGKTEMAGGGSQSHYDEYQEQKEIHDP